MASVKNGVNAQIERVTSLARRSEILYRLRVFRPECRSIIPVILALGELRERLIDGVPVVPVTKLVNFIYGLSPVDDSIKRIQVTGHGAQQMLS